MNRADSNRIAGRMSETIQNAVEEPGKLGYNMDRGIAIKSGGDHMLSSIIVNELISGLTEIFQDKISRIILFGSVARNEATEESDVDIAIIITNEIDEETKDKFINWAAELDIRFNQVFSIVDIPEERMKKWGKILPFYKNIEEEGIVLWRAA